MKNETNKTLEKLLNITYIGLAALLILQGYLEALKKKGWPKNVENPDSPNFN